MTPPIADQVERETGIHANRAIHDAERLIHHAIDRIRHTENQQTGKGPAMSFDQTLTADLTEGADYVEGWIGRVKNAAHAGLVDAVTLAQRYPTITAALKQAGDLIDPAGEQMVAGCDPAAPAQ